MDFNVKKLENNYSHLFDKKMLKRREECDTYLTHVCRHCWSRKRELGQSMSTTHENHSVG